MAASGMLRRIVSVGSLPVCSIRHYWTPQLLRPDVCRELGHLVQKPMWMTDFRCFGSAAQAAPASCASVLYAAKAAVSDASGASDGGAASASKSPTKSDSTKSSESSSSDESSESSSDDEKSDNAKGRRKPVDVETSIAYVRSSAFKEAYGDKPVWFHYRRNHKGGIAPSKTRKMCIRAGHVSTGNPCPICRDEYLLLHFKNIELLRQFVSEDTGEVLSFQKTGICQKQHKALLVAVEQAQDIGYLKRNVPLRMYDYADYYPWIPRSKEVAATDGTQDISS